MKEELIVKAYEVAKERYAAIGMDTDKAMDALQKVGWRIDRWHSGYR